MRFAGSLSVIRKGSLTVVAILVLFSVGGCSGHTKPAAPTPDPATAAAISTLTNLPPATLTAAGGGNHTVLTPIAGKPVRRQNGKPYVLYVGAEYCPYCAAQRWPLIIALSRFGRFTGLAPTASSPSDVNPSTPTWTFRSTAYSSDYLTFDGVETADVNDNPLHKLTPEQATLVKTYNAPPYVSAGEAGSIPFLDMANQFMVSGASYDPGALAGHTRQYIIEQLTDPNSPLAKAVLPVANRLTAGLCSITANKNAAVCSDPMITNLEKH